MTITLARSYPQNAQRNARAVELASTIETLSTRKVGRFTCHDRKVLVRDDLHWTILFVSDGQSGALLETITIYDSGRAARHGTYQQSLVTEALQACGIPLVQKASR